MPPPGTTPTPGTAPPGCVPNYAPVFPERFGPIGDARAFTAGYVEVSNHDHHHGGIGLHTRADVHHGHAASVEEQRSAALAAAGAAHPERFSSTADPKILALPTHAWITPPVLAQPSAA